MIKGNNSLHGTSLAEARYAFASTTHMLLLLGTLLVVCGCMAVNDDVWELYKADEVKRYKAFNGGANRRVLYWDCHDHGSLVMAPPRPEDWTREVPIFKGLCKAEFPSCNEYWPNKLDVDAMVLAYTYEQALACGEERCKTYVSSFFLFTYKGFELQSTPFDYIDEPDTWWQIIPFVGSRPIKPFVRLPLTGRLPF